MPTRLFTELDKLKIVWEKKKHIQIEPGKHLRGIKKAIRQHSPPNLETYCEAAVTGNWSNRR